MAFLEAKNLTKSYADGTRALNGVSFSINKGEFTAIMGPSGSGKSTLLHILGFLDRQSSGEYRFDGDEIDDLSPDELARTRNQRMGFIFQMFNLLPRESVFDNVRLPLLYSDADNSLRERLVREAVESVDLSHRIDHPTMLLSGGEKQRVAVARALVNNPDIIFADEPTGNLDSKSGGAIMNILQKLNEEKKHTVILITHETHTAGYAGRVIRLLDGKIERDQRVKTQRSANASFIK